jgi:hypothetical protein
MDSLRQTITVSDFSGFSATENRIVPGRNTSLQTNGSGTPESVSWLVPGSAFPVTSGTPVTLSFTKPGEYPVTQISRYPAYTDTIRHYNAIKVLSDVISYQAVTISNIQHDEHRGYTKMGGQGYIPGSNNMGITAYAEAFRNVTDSTFSLNGITIPVGLISKWQGAYYLPVVIWSAGKQVVFRDSVLISDFPNGSAVTRWLKSPVNFDTLIYVGFEVRPWEQGTFVANMATDRGERGANTAFAIKGSQWQSLTDASGIHTSLGISLVTSPVLTAFKEEIRIIPNFNDGDFSVDLGKLVFKDVALSVYTVTGQKVMADLTRESNRISFHVDAPVSGVYVVRLTIDEYQFATRVIIIRH